MTMPRSASTALLLLFSLLHYTTAFLSSSLARPRLLSFRLYSSSSRPVIDWAAQQTLEELVPKQNAYDILDELLHNDTLLNSTLDNLDKNWNSLETRLRDEQRPLSQILGTSATQRILDSAQNVEYDKDVVSTFLNSNAINSLFALVLYDGISEFTQRIDIFGNIVNTLPIIGPIRKQITQQFKRQLDATLGPLIQNFLKAYTKVAIQEAIDFILSGENQALFASANQKLVSNLLERPVSSLLFSQSTSSEVKTLVFDFLKSDVNMTDVERYLNFTYDLLDEKTIENVVDVNQVLDASPTLTKTLDSIWSKMKTADESSNES